MADINQKEDWRQYNTSKEFSKDIKFNKKWYHLVALFDYDQDNFDFNDNNVSNDDFDFNSTVEEPYDYQPNQYLDSMEFDFNSVLMEKYKITEIGLIMNELNEGTQIDNSRPPYKSSNIVGNHKSFNNFVNAINSKGVSKGFYIKTGLDVFVKGSTDPIASINDESQFKEGKKEICKNILKTLLKTGGGYANEATIELLGNLHKNDKSVKHESYKDRNIVQLLASLNMCNWNNAYAFPDTVFDINKNDVIPVDLKVAFDGRFSGASGNNKRYMSGIYDALLNAIERNETLIEYISKTKFDVNCKTINNRPLLAELKGFLLISSTNFNDDLLEFNNICIRPVIACMHGRSNVENDFLFASKDGNGIGAVSYDNGTGNGNNEIFHGGILDGCPIRFASVIKNFYEKLKSKDQDVYNNPNLKLPFFLQNDDNIEKIYNAINNKNYPAK